MQPILFLQSGDTGTIKRISGAEDTRRFLAGLGFVENAEVTVISQFDGNLIVNIKDSRVAVNKEMGQTHNGVTGLCAAAPGNRFAQDCMKYS